MTASVVGAADAFVITALQGAVGTVEHAQDPIARWIKLTGVLFVAMGGALIVTNRLLGSTRRWRGPRMWAMIVVAMTIIGVVAVGVLASYNYSTQVDRLDAAMKAVANHANHAAVDAARERSLDAQVRGATMAAIVVMLTNVVLVAWCLALCGGRMWPDRETEVTPTAE